MKKIQQLKSKLLGLGAVITMGAVSVSAHAAADYSTITAGVDWSSIGTAILALAAMIAGVYGVARGSKMLLNFIRS